MGFAEVEEVTTGAGLMLAQETEDFVKSPRSFPLWEHKLLSFLVCHG